MKYVLVAFILTGCSAMGNVIPSVQDCDQVLYQRNYQAVHIEALCHLDSARPAPQ